MKKFFKILAIAIVAIIVLMIAIPYLFKGEILKETKSVLNEKVEANVDFTDLNLSLFKRFPNLNVGVEQLSISGKGQFEKDTLVQFESFDVAVDLFSLMSKNIQVKGVYLIKPKINAIVARDSTVNWDIMPPSEEEPEEEPEDTTTTPTEYRVQLKRFQIKEAEITYNDHLSDMYANMEGMNFDLAGDFGADSTYLDVQMDINPILVKMGAINYLKDASFKFDAGIGANIEDGKYHFLKNKLSVNELQLNFDGLVQMAEDDKVITDVKFVTNNPSFKDLLSLVPAVYTKDFDDIETEGNLSLNGTVSGFYQDDILPDLDLNLLVENAMVSYPDFPKKIEDINISLQTYFNGEDKDESVVNLEKFHWKLGENPFNAAFKLRTPMSDPAIQANIDGKIDLSTFADVMPMEDTELKGIIRSDLSMKGRMSMIELEQYGQFEADGGIQMNDFYFSGPSVPVPFSISNADLKFSPQYVDLNTFESKFGESDLSASGKIENFLSYALKDGTIRGDFSVNSDYFNANQFLTEEEQEETVEDTTSGELSVFEVPGNIDFKLDSRFEHIVYDQMDITNAGGTILVKDQTIYLDDFNMNLFDGSMQADGEYSTQDTLKPQVSFDFALEEIRIENALKSFSMLDTLVPIMKNTEGDISLNMEYMSSLMPDMKPEVSTIKGFGTFSSDKLTLEGSKSLGLILQKLKLSKDKKHTFRNIDVEFTIDDGRIDVKPFDVKMGNIDMNVSGSQGIDQTMDYLVDMQIPKGKLGKAADEALNDLLSKATSRDTDIETSSTINVAAKLTGKFSDPKVNLLFGRGEGDEGKSAKEQVKDKVKDEFDKQKEDAEEKAREEAAKRAEQLVKEAKERAGKIRSQARKSAEEIRKEADNKADRIEKEAEGKNIIVRKAAEKSAEEVRKEADKRAEQLIKEADKRADQIVEQAEEKARKIKEGEQ
ncbi:MAG: AsmA-like C-terminal region-containing protein [Bacteroidota bacterium]